MVRFFQVSLSFDIISIFYYLDIHAVGYNTRFLSQFLEGGPNGVHLASVAKHAESEFKREQERAPILRLSLAALTVKDHLRIQGNAK